MNHNNIYKFVTVHIVDIIFLLTSKKHTEKWTPLLMPSNS